MEVAEAGASGEQGAGLPIDPFSVYHGVASRIGGLGGETIGHEPGYAFHTPYVQAARGRAEFTIRFAELAATRGVLTVRVHMLPVDHSQNAQLVNSERIALAQLAEQGGELKIHFQGSRGMSFAAYGVVPDDTDATASGLTVTLDQPHDGSEEHPMPARSGTRIGTRGFTETSRLVSTDRPSLASPVSQIRTAAQCRERPFTEWRARLGAAGADDGELWKQVFVLEALRRYGLLQPGSQGLGLGVAGSPLPAAMAALDVVVVAADAPGAFADPVLDGFRRPELCDSARFEANVSFQQIDMATIPAGFADFDFVWSSNAIGSLDTVATALSFIENAMACLHPGGLAIHMLSLVSDDAIIDARAPLTFFRRDVERMGLTLIARNYEVAQIKASDPESPAAMAGRRSVDAVPDVTPFGLIVRRPPEPA